MRPLLTALHLVLAFSLAACASAIPTRAPLPTPTATTPSTGRGQGGVLRMLYWQAPTILNPHLDSSLKDWEVSRITLEPLASFDAAGNLLPILAAQVPTLQNGGVAADGRSVTWRLRQNVRWSDGAPFTADDVLFTYDFITSREFTAATRSSYEVISAVVKLDDYTVRLDFKQPNPAWSLPFVGARGVILPRHKFLPYLGPEIAKAPVNTTDVVGTGPYRLASFRPQEVLFLGNTIVETNLLIFEANPFFREPDKPFFSRIELRGGITEEEAARQVLQEGSVDYAWNLQLEWSRIQDFLGNGAGRVLLNFGARTERILLNFTDPNAETATGERSSLQNPNPRLSDLRVRQAISLAIDREAIAALYGEAARPVSNNLIAPTLFNSPNTRAEYNLQRAAQLLDEAGWALPPGGSVREKDGQKLSLVFQTTNTAVRVETMRIVQNALAQIGVEVKLVTQNSTQFLETRAPGPNSARFFLADLQMYRNGNRDPDPTIFMQNWTSARIPQQSNNWQGENEERWVSAEYDALYQQVLTEIDPDKRRALFIQMNDLLINNVVMIPLIVRAEVSGINRQLGGVELTPWDSETWLIKNWRTLPANQAPPPATPAPTRTPTRTPSPTATRPPPTAPTPTPLAFTVPLTPALALGEPLTDALTAAPIITVTAQNASVFGDPRFVFDSAPTTWASLRPLTTTPASWVLHLPRVTTIRGLTLTAQAEAGQPSLITAVQVSLDGLTWQTVYASPLNCLTQPCDRLAQDQPVTLGFAPVSARYVALVAGPLPLALAEVAVLAAP